ncbi:MAG: PTS IIA-like nitrogen regulatory protein PtsN [Parvularculaceae bacterium]
MDLTDIISVKQVAPHFKARCKKQALEALAGFAAEAIGGDPAELLRTLQERERLGSTGMGGGVAIPHGRLPGLSRIYGFLALLDEPIDFEAVDGEPVDIIFLLLTPDQSGAEHLKALARISRVLRDRQVCEALRGARSAEAALAILSLRATSDAA